MIPSDHFVRYYNEVFKTLDELGREHLSGYWREIGRLQTIELAEKFRTGGLQAAHDYWAVIKEEEDCQGEMTLTEDYLEFRMQRCPSLAKVLDNDANACEAYCDHCMGWIEPVMEACGMYAAHDIESRTAPTCHFRVYRDKAAAAEFERGAKLLCKPYEQS